MSPEKLRKEIDAKLVYAARKRDCRFNPGPYNHVEDGSICCERCEAFVLPFGHAPMDGCEICREKNQSWIRFNLQFVEDYPDTYASLDALTVLSHFAPEWQQKIEAHKRILAFNEKHWPFPQQAYANELVRFDEYIKPTMEFSVRSLAAFYVSEERYDDAKGVLQRALALEISDSDRRILEKELAALPALMKLKSGEIAPTFQGKDLYGGTIDLEQLRGKVVLLDFWATWCGPCKRVTHEILGFYDDFDREHFEVVGISLDNPNYGEQVKAFVEEHAMDWPQIYQGQKWEDPIVKMYGVRGIPTTVLIDQEGRLVKVTDGLEKTIRGLLAQAGQAKE